MALTETRPDADEVEAEASPATPAATTTIDSVLGTGDHTTIGRLWIGFGALFTVAGLAFALVTGAELADLGSLDIADDDAQLTQIWSLGRDLLVFGGVMPILVGLGVFIVPLQVGASSLAFARGAAAAMWTWLLATGILILTYIMNGGPAGGRQDYVVLWTLTLGVMVASLLWALVCIATTVLGARATGMQLEDVPVTAWSYLVFAIGALLSLPVLIAELILAYIDVRFDFLPTQIDRLSLVAIGDSINLAPAVLVFAIPVLGIAVDAIGVHTGRPVRMHRSVLVAIALLGFGSYAAEMLSFAWRGRPIAFDNGLLVVATLFCVIPVLAILGIAGSSLRGGSRVINTPIVASLLSGLAILGGAGAAVLGTVDPIITFIEDLSDENIDGSLGIIGTSFHGGVRALVLGGVILGLIGAVHHFGHKIWGRTLDDRIGLLSALAAFGGTLLWGVTDIVSGFLDQPALPFTTTSPDDGVEVLNIVGTVGIGLLIAGVGLFLLNMAGVLAGRVGTAAEPWRGLTLEWATASPPEPGNFAEPPVVSSPTPLADLDEEGAS